MPINMLKHEINNFSDFNQACALFQDFIKERLGKPMEASIKEVKRSRNYSFHRKIFALVKFAYENTELPSCEYNGETIVQSKETFRKNLIIRSGFFKVDVIRENELRFIADSISYTRCSQSKAESIFNAMLDVVAKDLDSAGYTREKLIELSDKWSSFL